jgi:hypothetical protein
MTLKLYTEVALTQNIAEHNLKMGDIATLVDFVSHPQKGEEGCVLEIFNAVGESIAIVIVPVSMIKPLEANEILTTRSFM